ncbi:hypothetical protein HDF15_000784 [Granulicella mallensis]|uniref:Uncharacterized protein n=1 Tax=Granulicella mallensis TaxID=940614 RepID=A0A7W7ZM23_9BACT|nr:hypothetical protein [Granulicella mallensis]
MQWYKRFFQKISDLVPTPDVESTAIILSKLDPHHIEVENIRSLLGISHRAARTICETAVSRGLFSHRVVLVCPDDDSVAYEVRDSRPIPETLPCSHRDGDDIVRVEVPSGSLQRREFYVFNER